MVKWNRDNPVDSVTTEDIRNMTPEEVRQWNQDALKAERENRDNK
jgi:hypothetical protein